MGDVEYQRYAECEVCGQEIVGIEYRIGCAMHETCWKAVTDRARHERRELEDFDDEFIHDPIYLPDGRRAMELLDE